MAALKAFFDASRVADGGPPVLSVCGYIAPGAQWDRVFVPRWQRLLRRECIAPDPGYYHATDAEWPFYDVYAKVWRPKKETAEETQDDIDLAKNKAVVFKRGLASIIEDSAAFGVGAAVQMTGTLEDHAVAHQLCVKACLEMLVGSERVPTDKAILPVFEDGDGVNGAILGLCQEIRGMPEFARLGPPQFGTKLQYPPLQAADMLAFEVTKRCTSNVLQETRRRRIGSELVKRVETETWYFPPNALEAWIAEQRKKYEASQEAKA